MKTMSNGIPFETYQWASGHYLVRPLPDNWDDMDNKSQNEFLEDNACDLYDFWDAGDLWAEIDHLAYDAHKFFKGEK